MDHYLLLKSAHIFGVILFLGNIIVTAFWKTMADRTRSAPIIAYAQRLVTLTDIFFTVVGVVLIAVTGKLMAARFGTAGTASWITWGWLLFAASGVIWITVLLPVQVWQSRLAKQFANSTEIPGRYWKLSRIWLVFGSLATLLPLANLYFMVFKPV